MLKNKIYCRILPLKQNQKYGTMEQCVKKKQVRRFGEFKVDPKIVDDRRKLTIEVAKLRSRIMKLSKEYSNPKLKRSEHLAKKKELDKAKKELHNTFQ
jgi:hypothetical protein